LLKGRYGSVLPGRREPKPTPAHSRSGGRGGGQPGARPRVNSGGTGYPHSGGAGDRADRGGFGGDVPRRIRPSEV